MNAKRAPRAKGRPEAARCAGSQKSRNATPWLIGLQPKERAQAPSEHDLLPEDHPFRARLLRRAAEARAKGDNTLAQALEYHWRALTYAVVAADRAREMAIFDRLPAVLQYEANYGEGQSMAKLRRLAEQASRGKRAATIPREIALNPEALGL